MNELVKHNPLALAPNSLEQAEKIATIIAQSAFAPAAMRGKAGDVLVAIMMGSEIGLSPMQAIQNIAVINGRPSVWGDGAIALCKNHPTHEYIKEWLEGVDDNRVAHCECKRRNEPEVVRTFSVADAKKANLWGKAGPWTSYPNRMLQMRARGFAIRDTWPDALKGLITAEEAMDYPTPAEHGKPNGSRQYRATYKEPEKIDVVMDDAKSASIVEIMEAMAAATNETELKYAVRNASSLSEKERADVKASYLEYRILLRYPPAVETVEPEPEVPA